MRHSEILVALCSPRRMYRLSVGGSTSRRSLAVLSELEGQVDGLRITSGGRLEIESSEHAQHCCVLGQDFRGQFL